MAKLKGKLLLHYDLFRCFLAKSVLKCDKCAETFKSKLSKTRHMTRCRKKQQKTVAAPIDTGQLIEGSNKKTRNLAR